jgi:putative ABC transport system permease protein
MIRLVRGLLFAYPPSLRRAHGAEMAAAVEARWKDQRGLVARSLFVVELIGDFLSSWLREWRAVGAGRGATRGWRAPDWGLAADARTAVLLFTRAPVFVLGAVVTLALGIGATSAIFSLADATLLRPLPIRAPEGVWQVDFSWAHPDFRDLAASGVAFSDVVAWSNQTFALDRGGEAVEVPGAAVSGSYFGLTGLRPVLGRLLTDADDLASAAPVIVVSERAWTRVFGRDPEVIGRIVQLNRRPVAIVGIAPASFRGLSLRDAPEIFIPLLAMPKVATGFLARPGIMNSRDLVWLQVAGRLRDRVTPAQAAAAVAGVYRTLHPPKTSAEEADTVKLGPIGSRALGLDTADDSRRFVFILLGAAGVTLLLACATVANLLLVRSERRRRELAVRAALGASRARVVRLLFAESLAIGLAGSVGGLLVARLALSSLASFELPGQVLIQDLDLSLSPTLLATAVGLGIATSLVFGLAPAWQASRFDPQSALRDGARGTTRQPIRSALVTMQVALCVLLLAGSLAFGRAMRYALSIDMGFDTVRTSVTSVNPGRARYTPTQIAAVRQRIREALIAQRWVTAAGWSAMLPLRGSMQWTLGIGGSQTPANGEVTAEANVVSEGYFEAMGIPLRYGRFFAQTDTATAPMVMIVSESMANKYWPQGNAIGARVNTNTDVKDPNVIATVIGVVGDVKHDLSSPRATMFYATAAQQLSMLDFGGQHLIVRATVPSDVAVANVAAVIRRVDSKLPISRSQTIAQHLGALLMAQRLGLTLFLLFSGLAVVLTSFGLYAVVASAVAQRGREIGIRVALGAERASVLGLVARQGIVEVAAGLVAGLAAFVLTDSALSSFLLALPATNAVSLGALAVGIAALALIAMLVPARRALAVDPAIALRQE